MGNSKDNRRKRRVRYDRLGIATVVAVGTLVGATKGITNFFRQRNSSKNSTEVIEEFDDVFTTSFDSYNRINGVVNSDLPVYTLKDATNEAIHLFDSQEGRTIGIYKKSKILDNNNVEYYSCELEDINVVGLIKKSDISKITQKETLDCNFNNIYMQKDGEKEIKTSFEIDGMNLGENIKQGEIVFVDEFSARQDYQKNVWIKVRTNTGKVGYTILDDSLEKIDKVNVMEVTVDLQDLANNLPSNSGIERDLTIGDRVVAIESENSKNCSCVLYFDKNGIAKYGELYDEYLKEVKFDEQIKTNREKMQDTPNDVDLINSYIEGWKLNYKSGTMGIDFCDGMKPEDLKAFLFNNPKVDFCIAKIGGTYYGDDHENLKLADSSVLASDYFKERVSSQVSVVKALNKKIMGYFYATDINADEGYEIASYVEQCIDELGGGIVPILDVELADDTEDRMYWINKPNYKEYISTNFNAMEMQQFDFEEIENMSESERNAYVKDNPALIRYIEFCQTKRAEGIAAGYSKLYKDGYIEKNAILYTGNKTVSKNDYFTTIKTGEDASYEKIVVFKYDEVVDLLTNPNSPYFISEDFNLKVWYADYTNKENFKMLDNGSALTQSEGDIEIPGTSSKYDINYACKEFIKLMFHEKIVQEEYVSSNSLTLLNQEVKDDDEYIME